MYVVFDTETTGIAPKGTNWETDYNQFPFIVQLSWKRSDRVKVNDFIIKPDRYEIPEEASKIHGITTNIAIEKGNNFNGVIANFINDCIQAEKVIGHNIYFDTSNLKANVIKTIEKDYLAEHYFDLINKALDKSKRIDTMMKTIKFCALPQPNGRGLKWPKLQELYKKLFDQEFDAHNSKNDVIATERCYLELVKRGIINT